MIKFSSLVESRPIRKSPQLILWMDLPMFSVYLHKDLKLKDIKKLREMENEVKRNFDMARHEIHSIGFPSMHANVIITDLSQETNWITGIKGGVGGYAMAGNPKKNDNIKDSNTKHIVLNYTNVTIHAIIHEWAHIWMFNNGKRFIEAVKTAYFLMKKIATTGIKAKTHDVKKTLSIAPYQHYDYILDTLKSMMTHIFNIIRDEDFKHYVTLKYPITLQSLDLVPQGIRVTGKLKKYLVAHSFSGYYHTFPVGAEVYVEKGSSAWIIGNYVLDKDNTRYEKIINTDEIVSYVGPHIIKNIRRAINDSINIFTNRYPDENQLEFYRKRIYDDVKTKVAAHIHMILMKLQIHEFNKSSLESGINKSADSIFHKLMTLIDSKESFYELYTLHKNKYNNFNDKTYVNKVDEDFYKQLWVNNEFKDENFSWISTIKQFDHENQRYKISKEINNNYYLSGPEYELHRSAMSSILKWGSSYGMANEHELWATAIDNFANMDRKYRKLIFKLMENPEKFNQSPEL